MIHADQTTVPGLTAQLKAANRRGDRREAIRVKALLRRAREDAAYARRFPVHGFVHPTTGEAWHAEEGWV